MKQLCEPSKLADFRRPAQGSWVLCTGKIAMGNAEDGKGAKAKDATRAGIKTRTIARAKAGEATAKTKISEVAEATESDVAEVRVGPMAEANDIQAAQMKENAATEQDARTEGDEDYLAAKICAFQKLGTEQLEPSTTLASSLLETLHAIATERNEYSSRLLQNRYSFIVKLLGATTFESATQIRLEHAQASYAGFISYLSKMTELRADLAKEFFKPIEMMFARTHGGKE
jgi:Phasin protein